MVRGTWHRHGELSALTADKQTKRAQRFRLFGSELIRLWYRHTLNRHRTNILRPEMWCVGFCTRQTSPIAKHIGNFPENLMFPFQKKRRRRVNDWAPRFFTTITITIDFRFDSVVSDTLFPYIFTFYVEISLDPRYESIDFGSRRT